MGNLAHGARVCIHMSGVHPVVEEESKAQTRSEDGHVCSREGNGRQVVVADWMAGEVCEIVRKGENNGRGGSGGWRSGEDGGATVVRAVDGLEADVCARRGRSAAARRPQVGKCVLGNERDQTGGAAAGEGTGDWTKGIA